MQQLNERKKNTTSVLLQGTLLYGQNTKPYIIVSYNTHTVLNNSASNSYNNNYRRRRQCTECTECVRHVQYRVCTSQESTKDPVYTADLIYDRFVSRVFFHSFITFVYSSTSSRAVLIQMAAADLRSPTIVCVRAHIVSVFGKKK